MNNYSRNFHIEQGMTELMTECDTIKNLDKHPNVVHFIGVIVKDIFKGLQSLKISQK